MILYIYLKNEIDNEVFSYGFSENFNVSMKENKLLVVKKANGLTNFFGPNIFNAQLLVGKNGSGKTKTITNIIKGLSLLEERTFLEDVSEYLILKLEDRVISYETNLDIEIDYRIPEFVLEESVKTKEKYSCVLYNHIFDTTDSHKKKREQNFLVNLSTKYLYDKFLDHERYSSLEQNKQIYFVSQFAYVQFFGETIDVPNTIDYGEDTHYLQESMNRYLSDVLKEMEKKYTDDLKSDLFLSISSFNKALQENLNLVDFVLEKMKEIYGQLEMMPALELDIYFGELTILIAKLFLSPLIYNNEKMNFENNENILFDYITSVSDYFDTPIMNSTYRNYEDNVLVYIERSARDEIISFMKNFSLIGENNYPVFKKIFLDNDEISVFQDLITFINSNYKKSEDELVEIFVKISDYLDVFSDKEINSLGNKRDKINFQKIEKFLEKIILEIVNTTLKQTLLKSINSTVGIGELEKFQEVNSIKLILAEIEKETLELNEEIDILVSEEDFFGVKQQRIVGIQALLDNFEKSYLSNDKKDTLLDRRALAATYSKENDGLIHKGIKSFIDKELRKINNIQNAIMHIIRKKGLLTTDSNEIKNYFQKTEGTFNFLNFHWRKLSSGEFVFLSLFSRLFDHKKRGRLSENIILLIDEADLYLHPQWQKQYFYLLLKFCSEVFSEHKFQIVAATHSPFLVSDFPQKNIINLDSSDFSANTFGANIQELFFDSFYLQKGLTGEFAKQKINTLKKDISNLDEITKEKYNSFSNAIEIIGEPLVRNHLRRMLVSKLGPKYKLIEEISALEQQIERKRLKLDEANQNNRSDNG